ncbi:MAG: DsbA family protein [Microthrixaceae bacterium]
MNTPPTPLAELDGGPHDVEFFFDPGCPFAWQTSRWIRRVVELEGISVGWRLISLQHINHGRDQTSARAASHRRTHRILRVAAAVRQRAGNEAVGAFYRAWGDRLWTQRIDVVDFGERMATAFAHVDLGEVLGAADVGGELAAAVDDPAFDVLIATESDEALRRTGPEVGTPIITYDPPYGSSMFGPVISALPDDETSVAFYRALRTMVDFDGFSELKRTNRPDLDLPLLQDA